LSNSHTTWWLLSNKDRFFHEDDHPFYPVGVPPAQLQLLSYSILQKILKVVKGCSIVQLSPFLLDKEKVELRMSEMSCSSLSNLM
jgi:hypothetical protein